MGQASNKLKYCINKAKTEGVKRIGKKAVLGVYVSQILKDFQICCKTSGILGALDTGQVPG